MESYDVVCGFLIGVVIGFFLLGSATVAENYRFTREIEACQFAGHETAVHDYAGVAYCVDEGALVLYSVEGP